MDPTLRPSMKFRDTRHSSVTGSTTSELVFPSTTSDVTNSGRFAVMSAQRLLVLGCVRIFEPVHGYDVRRELLTWRVEDWANLSPGSIYSLLKRLDRDGLIEVDGLEQDGNRPTRTKYTVTKEGEAEFVVLLRDALWNATGSITDLMAAVSFMWALPREEVTRALRHRITTLDGLIDATDYATTDLLASDVEPDHVAEMLSLKNHQRRAEQQWARQLLERLRMGDYSFKDEGKSLFKT